MFVKCPMCSQPLNIAGMPGGTVLQCPCGAKLKVPETQTPRTQAPSTPTPASNPHPPQQPAQPHANLQGQASNPPLPSPAPSVLSQTVSHAKSMVSALNPQNSVNQMSAAMEANDSSSGSTLNNRQRLELVNNAVRLVFYGTIGMIGAYIASFFGLISIPVIGQIIGIAALGAKTAIIVGYVMSYYAPPESNTRKYIIAALIVSVSGGVFVDLAVFVMQNISGELGLALLKFLSLVGFTMPVLSVAIYLYFLRALALYTGDKDAAENAGEIAFHLIILTAIQFVLGSVSASIALPGFVLWIMGIAFLIAYVQWLIRYLQFLDSLHFRKRAKAASASSSSSNGGWAMHR